MGWFDKAKRDFEAGADSVQIKKCLEAFMINEQQFIHAFDSVNRDLSKMRNYREQFEMMQKLIDNFLMLFDKHENQGSIVAFLSVEITVNWIGRITVQRAFSELEKSIDRIHERIGQTYFRS